MSRPKIAPLTIVCIFMLGSLANAADSNHVTITGRVVAYTNSLACLNSNVYWTMVIHVQPAAKAIPSEFVQVQFSSPCGETPKLFTEKSSLRTFRLQRDKDQDSVLKEFWECSNDASKPCSHMRAWKYVRGMEHEKLPFEKLVPGYRSQDLPIAPVL